MIKKSCGLLAVAIISLTASIPWLAAPSPTPARRTDRERALTPDESGKRFRTAVMSQNHDMENLLPAWVNSDATAAARYVSSLPLGELREKAMRILTQHWGARDPQSAIVWADRLPDASEREPAVTNILLGFAIEHPAEAVTMAAAQPSQESGLLENLTQQWAEKDPSAASHWALAGTAGDERDRLLQRVTLIQSRTRPFDAANLALEQITPGDLQIETLISILHQWAKSDLPAATAWAMQFPEGDLRDRAIAETDGLAR